MELVKALVFNRVYGQLLLQAFKKIPSDYYNLSKCIYVAAKTKSIQKVIQTRCNWSKQYLLDNKILIDTYLSHIEDVTGLEMPKTKEIIDIYSKKQAE